MPVRTFIKIEADSQVREKAIKALENMALKLPEVCIMDTIIRDAPYGFDRREDFVDYFMAPNELTEEVCNRLISKSGKELGEYDFFFEWFRKPTKLEHDDLLKKIDEILSPMDVKYKVTN